MNGDGGFDWDFSGSVQNFRISELNVVQETSNRGFDRQEKRCIHISSDRNDSVNRLFISPCQRVSRALVNNCFARRFQIFGWHSIDCPAGLLVGSFVLDSGSQESWVAQRSFTDEVTMIGETETSKLRLIRIQSFNYIRLHTRGRSALFLGDGKMLFYWITKDEIVQAAVRARLLQGS